MPFTVVAADPAIVLSIQGDFDALLARELRGPFDDLVERENRDVVVDLSDTDFIDSSGIGALVFLFKRLTSQKRRFEIQGVGEQPLYVMRLCGIDKVIPVRGAGAGAAA